MDLSIDKIIYIQKNIRGFLIRKKLKQLKDKSNKNTINRKIL